MLISRRKAFSMTSAGTVKSTQRMKSFSFSSPGGALSSCSERKYVSKAVSRLFKPRERVREDRTRSCITMMTDAFVIWNGFMGTHSPPGICGAEFPALMQNGREHPADIIWGQAGEYAGCQEK